MVIEIEPLSVYLMKERFVPLSDARMQSCVGRGMKSSTSDNIILGDCVSNISIDRKRQKGKEFMQMSLYYIQLN